MFSFRPNLFNHEIGIDIGTVNTVIYVKSKGVVINEPSVIAVRNLGRKGQKEIIAFGAAAKKMVGRTPQGITTVRPLSHGVIADFEMTQHMIRHYMSQATASGGMFSHPRVAVCVPASVTEVEKRAVVEVTLAAGAKEAFVVEEPLAAAVGIGLAIDEAQGNMVVNMGGGTCEVAVLSLGGIVINQSVRVAGDALDEAIISMLRQNYTLAIGESTAEEIKIAIGSVIPLDQELKMDVKGRDLVDGLPKVVSICSEEVRESIEPIVMQIEETIRSTLERTPPELVRDIVDQGIVLSGGTANLRGLNIRFADALNVPIHIAEQPVFSVALGLGKILEMPQDKNRLSITVEKQGA
ncbi:rod shape-determining protein [Cloacibacillus evryensis]|uniref:Cell shape-determining protein MreB n=1 Tax=Cloacibacillus evryensis TaxID=508460 RepID=A0AAW5JYW6_9BACT|nr:rod shape-determining protein [Cloacibacillus evryensis]EHL64657.1 MreB/Mrl family cell shape determining protein [Synergistes sp. 3_1_syn1]MCQ4763806.1 rod shape-determining protein [Cloacibacillus evryensis]MCQ4813417.1 rod shape-determining protein [Cloacibacillus evryensis]MEA5034608.1 rod shape-determining protein [Cloacibacillus evryensis]